MKDKKQTPDLTMLLVGTQISLAPKFITCDATRKRLAGRIGCQTEQLTDGSLTYVGQEEGQVLVGRPLKAGTVPVAAKFFVPHVSTLASV